MKRLFALLLLLAAPVPGLAQDMQAPRIVVSKVDWDAAAKSVAEGGAAAPAVVFSALNAVTGKRFAGIEKSSVPVLLPLDVAALRKDQAAGASDDADAKQYFGDFTPSKFFLAGPAGYDATFFINPRDVGLRFSFPKPVEIEMGGAAYVYELDAPDHQEVFPPPKELAEKFPGMQRILRENHVRYAFARFGVSYVMSIQCYDRGPSRRYLSCREADQVALRFLNRLQTAGGTPQTVRAPKFDLARPQAVSPDFTYYAPGDLIANSGWRKNPGRADDTVYARLRFPIAQAPAYVKSQSFMPWGDCYRTGHTGGRLGRKDMAYSCKVNGIPLRFNEAAAENFTYPWRDNFCEMRDFLVGQCPGGWGHQGEDLRPATCVLKEAASDRCLPYQHDVAAALDGLLWRNPGNLGVYIVVNSADEHVRVRYLHMNPKMMDADGALSGRTVAKGEIIGKVATWGDYERGTSYHIHFNLQVFTRAGWVWVNPYMTLVSAYERLIGGRGSEIKPGDPAPPVPDKPPVILTPTPKPAPGETTTRVPEQREKVSAKPDRSKKKRVVHKRRRHRQRRDEAG